jgi:peroxiredoxin
MIDSVVGLRVARSAPAGLRNLARRGEDATCARELVGRLVGLQIPHVVLGSFQGSPCDLGQFASAFPVVIYFYPGSSSSPEDGNACPMTDAVQNRVFNEHDPEFVAHGYRAIGISSQSAQEQHKSAAANRISLRLLTDPKLQLAQELELPTFIADGARWYQRLTLVAVGGTIAKAFYPVPTPARSAAQVLAWLQVHGA